MAPPSEAFISTRRQRLHALTSLRFFAAAWVFLHHAAAPYGGPIAQLGFCGVEFFFVLSGFVLTWSGAGLNGALPFWRNRAARILPLHYLTLLVAFVAPYPGGGESALTLLQNITLTQAWTDGGLHSFNELSWSISAEAFFYLLFPVASAGLELLGNARALALIACALMTQALIVSLSTADGWPEWFLYFNPLLRLDEFLLGILVARLFLAEGVTRSRAWLLTVWALAMTVVALSRGYLNPLYRARADLALLPATVTVLMWAVLTEHRRDGRRSWLTSRVLVRLGEWSFAFYMVHQLVIRLTARCLQQADAWSLPPLVIPLTFAVSVLLAAVTCEYVEKPLERRLRARRRNPTAAVVLDLTSVTQAAPSTRQEYQ